MPELRTQTGTKQSTELPVSEIFRLAQKFRHMAKDLQEVFIQASRQQIIYRIETDPAEEETLGLLHSVRDLGQRLKQRLLRRNYSAPKLVTKAAAPVAKSPLESQINRGQENRQQVNRVADEQIKSTRPANPKPIQPKPEQAVSLMAAASKLKAKLDEHPEASKKESSVSIPKQSALSLSPEEMPKYKKYRDLAEQFLDAKQLPHVRTLLDKARTELSPEAVSLLEDFGRSKGLV